MDDDGFFPVPADFRIISTVLALAFGIIILGSVTIGARRNPQVPPNDVFGCYRAAGAPDILVTPSNLIVLQPKQIRLTSKLIYIKGWKFDIDHWLDFGAVEGNRIEVEATWPDGQHLPISRETATGPSVPQFELLSRKQMLQITYRKVADTCEKLVEDRKEEAA